jgi:acyl carrier protein
MTTGEFFDELRTLIQREDPIAPHMRLRDIPEWDSLAIMGCMAFFHGHFGVRIPYSAFQGLSTVEDLVALAKGAIR